MFEEDDGMMMENEPMGVLDQMRQEYDPGEMSVDDMLFQTDGLPSDQEFLGSADFVEDPTASSFASSEVAPGSMEMGGMGSDDPQASSAALGGSSELGEDSDMEREELMRRAQERAMAAQLLQSRAKQGA